MHAFAVLALVAMFYSAVNVVVGGEVKPPVKVEKVVQDVEIVDLNPNLDQPKIEVQGTLFNFTMEVGTESNVIGVYEYKNSKRILVVVKTGTKISGFKAYDIVYGPPAVGQKLNIGGLLVNAIGPTLGFAKFVPNAAPREKWIDGKPPEFTPHVVIQGGASKDLHFAPAGEFAQNGGVFWVVFNPPTPVPILPNLEAVLNPAEHAVEEKKDDPKKKDEKKDEKKDPKAPKKADQK